MDKRPQRLAKNKTALMPKNASCKRWDTLINCRGVCGARFGELGERAQNRRCACRQTRA